MNTEVWRLDHCQAEQNSDNLIVGLYISFVKQICALSLVLTPLPPTVSLLQDIFCLLAALLRIPDGIRPQFGPPRIRLAWAKQILNSVGFLKAVHFSLLGYFTLS